ncbi:hypothetical protein [Hamadaea tsunoensis]|uniref:hypothetical protein n=1 Tax=Hamadaea tsunoensis TaxID=53368 RepID=UPI00040FF2D4|nr:hypothetical protein [Hamadaea tsunoensis]
MPSFRISSLARVPMRAVRTATRTGTARLTAWAYRPKVVSIECPHCGKWVRPRNYERNAYLCKNCAPHVAHARFVDRPAATAIPPMAGGRQGVLVSRLPIRTRKVVAVR